MQHNIHNTNSLVLQSIIGK